ncbi:DUF1697 domain-containing protein [Vicingaceae bacterium]|nr:DUF1697 domain-containing protein [Vicingaceae bacterium]
MKTYFALLRGINVGGKNKLLMRELKQVLDKIGLNQLTTYIQSGNVVFQSTHKTTVELRILIEESITKEFGLRVTTLVITLDQLIELESANPYHLQNIEIEKKYGCFTNAMATDEGLEKLARFNIKNDEYIVQNQFIYLNYANRAGNSKLTTNLIENKLNLKATTRNWKTICQLIEISKAMA